MLAVLLGLTALVAWLWLAFGVADAGAAFEPAARRLITGVLLAVCAVGLVGGSAIALRMAARTAAARADNLLGDTRRTTAAALALDPGAAATPLAAWLAGRTREAAAAALAGLSARRLLPWRVLGWTLMLLVVPLVAVGVLRVLHPAVVATVAQRLLQPGADIPPFTRLVFAVSPPQPAVVYGGDLAVTVDITGDAIRQPVACLVRKPGERAILKLPAFRESPSRFSRTLDGLTEAVEVAFAVGKARSVWHPVEILTEPNILSGVVRVAPPAYTGLPPAEFPLDTNELAAVEGSTVTLELASNRPLGGATLAFTPAALPGQPPEVATHQAELRGTHTAAFTWTATASGRLAATLRDIRGTPSPRPLELAFRALPDKPPAVLLESPPALMLATPAAVIPLAGHAEDDFALAKVHLVRALAGFRDRSQVVAPSLTSKRFDFSARLDLDELGAQAGETIELMLDASDRNPSLLGQGASEISRIRIISEDDYARYLRARTTVDEFAARFRAAREAIEQAREALDRLDQAVDKGDAKAIREAAEAAAEAHRKAAELLEEIAGDFPAFELEKRLKDLAERQADDLRANIAPLRDLDPAAPPEDLKAQIEELRQRLGARQEMEERMAEDFELAHQAARLLEMAAEFRRIYEDQANLAKRFGAVVEELREGIDRNLPQLMGLAETQRKNRESLDGFKRELQRRLDALPADEPALGALAESAAAFLDELTEAQPETLMDAAADHARAGDARAAFDQAERARALLQRFLDKQDPFADAARGEAPEFQIPDVDRNLAELLEGMLGRMQGMDGAPQPGGGAGAAPFGMGGDRADGFSMNLPVAGPERLRFSDSPSQAGRGGGEGRGGATPPLPETAESGVIAPAGQRAGQSAAPESESVPEPYREAVRRFLTP
jgi:ABC-type transporter Mla subunit MlaD